MTWIKTNKTAQVVFSAILFIVVWQLIIFIGGYEEALLPSPITVASSLWKLLITGELLIHLQVSFFRFLVGYLCAVVLAVTLGLFLGRSPFLWAILDPIVQVIRPVAPIAWTPFIVLWFGIGSIPAIIIIFIASFFPVLLSTVSAVRKVDPIYLKVAQNLEIKGPSLLFKIIFPAAFPTIANGLHMALGTAWIFLVAGEMVGAQSGLGYFIIDSRNALDLDHVLAGILVIGVTGLILDRAIRLFERWVEKQWGVEQS